MLVIVGSERHRLDIPTRARHVRLLGGNVTPPLVSGVTLLAQSLVDAEWADDPPVSLMSGHYLRAEDISAALAHALGGTSVAPLAGRLRITGLGAIRLRADDVHAAELVGLRPGQWAEAQEDGTLTMPLPARPPPAIGRVTCFNVLGAEQILGLVGLGAVTWPTRPLADAVISELHVRVDASPWPLGPFTLALEITPP